MAAYYYTVQTVIFFPRDSKVLVIYVNSYITVHVTHNGKASQFTIVPLTITDSKVLNGGKIAGRINPTSKHSGPHS